MWAMTSRWPVTLTFALFALLAGHLGIQATTSWCSHDLVLMIDTSTSIANTTEFPVFLEAINNFLGNSDRNELFVSEECTNVGVISFSSTVTSYNFTGNLTEVTETISGLTQASGGTRAASAFIQARQLFRTGREGVLKSVVFISDGKTNQPPVASARAQDLREDGVNVYCIALRMRGLAYIQLLDTVGRNSSRLYTQTSFAILPNISFGLSPPSNSGRTPTTTAGPTTQTTSTTSTSSPTQTTTTTSTSSTTQTTTRATTSQSSTQTASTTEPTASTTANTATSTKSSTASGTASTTDPTASSTTNTATSTSSSITPSSTLTPTGSTVSSSTVATSTASTASTTSSSTRSTDSTTVSSSSTTSSQQSTTPGTATTSSSSQSSSTRSTTDVSSTTVSSSTTKSSSETTTSSTPSTSTSPASTSSSTQSSSTVSSPTPSSTTASTSETSSSTSTSTTSSTRGPRSSTTPGAVSSSTTPASPTTTTTLPTTTAACDGDNGDGNCDGDDDDDDDYDSQDWRRYGDTSMDFNSTGVKAGLCRLAAAWEGFGFVPHPTDQTKYMQCHLAPDGNVTASVRSCPSGQYWQMDGLKCVEPEDKKEHTDMCANRYQGYTMKMDGGCGLYWECDKWGVARALRCLPYHAYYPGKGCMYTTECENEKSIYCEKDGYCEYTPSESSNGYYIKQFGGLRQVYQKCTRGTKFDIATCGCRHPPYIGTACSVSVNIPLPGVKVTNDVTSCKMHPNQKWPVTVLIEYKPSASPDRGTSEEVLLRSKHCMNTGLFVISETKNTLYVRVFSKRGLLIRLELPLKNLPESVWRSVTVQYDDGELRAQVDVAGLSYASVVEGGLPVSVGACGWVTGEPGELKDYLAPFTGTMQKALLSRC